VRRVIPHWGVSDGSDGERPLSRSHSARTELFFADGCDTVTDKIVTGAVSIAIVGIFNEGVHGVNAVVLAALVVAVAAVVELKFVVVVVGVVCRYASKFMVSQSPAKT
jgi:hypothetical protein